MATTTDETNVKTLDPTAKITIGDEDIRGYSTPNNTVSPSYVLPAKTEYEVTGMSTIDPSWIRVKWKTTGQGGQVKYETVWTYVGKNSDGKYTASGTTSDDKQKLSDLASEISSSIGAGSDRDNSEDAAKMIANNNQSNVIRDISHISTEDDPNTDEYIVSYSGDYQMSLDEVYTHYLLLAVKAYGAPPQTTMYADPRIISLATSFGPTVLVGRKFADVIVSNPTILSLCPGVVKYNQLLAGSFDKTDEDSILAYAQKALSNDQNGKICEFQPCWYSSVKSQDGYIKYVNALNQVTAIAMSRQKINDDEGTSLAERRFPGDRSNSLYRNFDWQNYDTPDNDVNRIFSGTSTTPAQAAENLVNNITKVIKDFKSGTLLSELSEAIGSYKYINFYCSGNNSVSEQFETSVRSSTLEDMINGQLSSTIKEIAFYTGGLVGDAALEDIDKWANETSTSLGLDAGLLKSASEIFSGGRIVFPQIVDDCTYGKECQFTVRFIAGSGNCEARYLMRCEFNHLLAFILPKQLKGQLDMYTTPFLVRAVCRGRFSCEMGVLTNIRVTYGGQDDMAWTVDGQPTEMEVSFSITPLYTKLYMTSRDQLAGMFLKNTGMMEYILVNSGVDLRIPQLQMKADILAGMDSGYVTSVTNPENLFERLYNSKIVTSLREIMNF